MTQTALITGASSGIGLEMARLFASEGTNLVLVARSEGKLKELAAELQEKFPVRVQVLAADLSSVDAAVSVHRFCADEGLAVDILVNNAGFGDFGFFADSQWEKQLAMIQLNIVALTQLTHLFLPQMIRHRKGRVLNVASTAAFQPGPTMAVYYATKAFVLHFSEAIANELKGTGVTVTALCPGATESGFQKAAAMEESGLVKDRKLPTSEKVARYGYRALMAGKTVAIHGFKNKVLANAVRFMPRSTVTKITRSIQDVK